MIATETLSKQQIQQFEQIEANYWSKYYDCSSSIASYASIIGGSFVGSIPSLDILAMNRVIGLGHNSKIKAETIDEVIHFFESAQNKKFFLQLTPEIVNDETKSILINKGFYHRNNWVKLYREAKIIDQETNPELTIETLSPDRASLFGQLIFMSFDWADSRIPEWLSGTVGKSGYKHYVVTYQNKAIAAGALFLEHETAAMAFAGTLEEFRGLGAQKLLLKTRINDAVTSGVKTVISETAEPLEGKLVQSYENMRAMGFRIAYKRQNWCYEF